MNYYQILKITGIILLIFSFFLLIPLIASFYYAVSVDNFLQSFLIVFFSGLITYFPNKKEKSQIKIKRAQTVAFERRPARARRASAAARPPHRHRGRRGGVAGWGGRCGGGWCARG